MTSALKKMGYENGQVAIESLGLQGALDALKESVSGDELAFAGMFSSVEAKTAVLALAGAQSEDFTNKTKEMYSATGAAESAFDTQTANLKGTLGKLKQAASTAVIELGEKFLPVVQTLAEWVLENMPAIQATIEVVFDYLTTVTNTCVEYITMLKDAASAWVTDHQETVNAILTAIQNLWQFVQTIFSALMTAAGALGEWFGSWADENLGGLVQIVTAALESIVNFISAFVALASAIWRNHGQTIMSIIGPLLEAVKTIISTTLQAITQIFNIFAALLRGDIGDVLSGVLNLVVTILNGIVTTVGNILQSIINNIFAAYNDFFNAGRSIFQGLFDGIAGVWGSIYNWVIEKVNWLSDRLSFWNSSQSKMSANGSHATGLEYVPFDGYRAILHKGERVLTAEQAKEADKANASKMQGCRNYGYTYAITVAQTDAKSVILKKTDAASLVVGSAIDVGDGSDRQNASSYAVASSAVILSIEAYDDNNSRVNLDLAAGITTTTSNKINTIAWRSGSCDNVLGVDGSPTNCTSGKEPFIIQGIECMVGAYEVYADAIFKLESTDGVFKITPWICKKASEITNNAIGSAYKALSYSLTPPTSAGWRYISSMGFDPAHPCANFPDGLDANSNTGYRAGFYSENATNALREWLAVGNLGNGTDAALGCASSHSGLGFAWWYISGRACGTAGNRGEFAA